MAYLSQNHCLENLEFTMDASRYRKHYQALHCSDPAHVRKLWQKLLDAYIAPNGAREVNLPCCVRDKLLAIPNRRSPPPPEALEPAVRIVRDLMQESVLVPFLTECAQTASYHNQPVQRAPTLSRSSSPFSAALGWHSRSAPSSSSGSTSSSSWDAEEWEGSPKNSSGGWKRMMGFSRKKSEFWS